MLVPRGVKGVLRTVNGAGRAARGAASPSPNR